jgi:transcriptional regulator with XRE-family HTH domain
MRTHREYLASELKDEAFAREFRREKAQLRIAYDIQTTRQRLGLTQKDLAGMAGVTQQMVSRVETARTPNMTHGSICRIAAALDMDVGLVARRPAHVAAKTGKKVRA